MNENPSETTPPSRAATTAKAIGASSAVGAQALLTSKHMDPFTASALGAGIGAGVEDFLLRAMSARERSKVVSVASLAAELYKQRYERGDDLRDDEFIRGDPSDFSQTVEGILITAQREHEDNKLPYMAHFLANLAYMPEIDAVTANWALRTARDLSWTQYVLLALNNEDESKVDRERISAGRKVSTKNLAEWSTWNEFEDLAGRSLIGNRESLYQNFTQGTIPPRMLWVPKEGGRLLVTAMSLNRVPAAERDRVYRLLNDGAAPL